MEWSCGDDGAVGEDDVDDDPYEARDDDDDDDDGGDLPTPGRNFPGRFLPVGELFFSLLFPSLRRRRNISSMAPPTLRACLVDWVTREGLSQLR